VEGVEEGYFILGLVKLAAEKMFVFFGPQVVLGYDVVRSEG
jgi:hypothetical protein